MTKTITEKWTFPGKVLFVDNKFDEVKELMREFTEKGISVQYWNGKTELMSPMSNVRIIILDLKLTADQGDEKNEAYFFPAAEVLSKITGPYLLIILSTDYEEGDIPKLKKTYKEYNFSTPLYSIEEFGLEKYPDFPTFYDRIKNVFDRSDIFKMILAWGRLMDLAKDKALGDLTKEELQNEIHAFVKSIAEDVGEESLSREFVTNMIRFVSRYMNTGVEFLELTELLKKLNNVQISGKSFPDPILQHLHMYYFPEKTEKIWTGDIFRIHGARGLTEGKDHWKYGIILTPACDIAQPTKAIDTLLLCEGFPLDYHSICQLDHPFRKLNKSFKVAPDIDRLPDGDEKEKRMMKLLKDSMNNLPKKFYSLLNFKDNSKYFGLCFDFQHVSFVDKSDFEAKNKENRICRLDSPFIEDLLQKYGAYSTRLGVPGVNSFG